MDDAAKAFAEAKKLDLDANKIVWLSPAPATTTWPWPSARMSPTPISSRLQ